MSRSVSVISSTAIIALLSVGTASAEGHGGHGAKSSTVTLKGEVVDLHCFLSHPKTGQGPKHAKCATACMNKGIPAGFLANGQLYLLLDKSHGPAGKKVASLAGKQTSLTGKTFDLHGMKAIQIEKIDGMGGHGGGGGHEGHGH